MSTMRTYNVEAGLPVLDEARRLDLSATNEGVTILWLK
jgi:hypothetical protein